MCGDIFPTCWLCHKDNPHSTVAFLPQTMYLAGNVQYLVSINSTQNWALESYWQWKPSIARELTSLSNTPLGTTKVKVAMLVSENCKLKAGHPFNVSKLQSPYCTWSRQTIHILRKPLQFVKGTDYIQHPTYSWSYFQICLPNQGRYANDKQIYQLSRWL